MSRPAGSLLPQLRALLGPARQETASDGQLLARWVDGRDSQAFAALVWRHGALVWRVGRSIVPQREDAEDAFQATFLILARKAASLQGRASIAGWLHNTAHRLALKARIAAVRRRRRDEQAAKSCVVDPLEEISVREARTILEQELDRLPAAYREPLLLCIYEGATQDEAAKRLDCSPSTLKRRLDRGRHLLGQRLKRRGLASESALVLSLCGGFKAPVQVLVQTLNAVERFATGQVLAGTAVGLADSALRTLLLKKLVFCLTAVIGLGGLTLAGAGAYSLATPTSTGKAVTIPQTPQIKEPAPAPPLLDRNGEPLPPGAVTRIGNTQFRHSGIVHGIAYTPDGQSIVSDDGNLRLWDAGTGKLRWRLELDNNMPPEIAVSGDGKRLAAMSNTAYVLVETETGKVLARHTWGQDPKLIFSKGMAHDLNSFVIGSSLGSSDRALGLYDAATGKEKRRLQVGDRAADTFPGQCWFSPDDKTIVARIIDVDGRIAKPGIRAFDSTTGKPAPFDDVSRKIKAALDMLTAKDPAKFFGVSFRDLHSVAALVSQDRDSEDARFTFLDLTTGKQQHAELHHLVGGTRYAWSAHSDLYAIGSQSKEILIFDTFTGKVFRRLDVHGFTTALAFSPDGKTLASASQHGFALWDLATGKLLPQTPNPTESPVRLRFDAGGKQLLTFSNGVYWWDVSSGQCVRQMPEEPQWYGEYGGESVSLDGKLLAEPLLHGDVLLIDTNTGKTVRSLTGKNDRVVNASAFSPDGTKIFTAGGRDPGVIVWDVAPGKVLHELHSHTSLATRIVVSPDGRWLASSSQKNVTPADYDIRLWDIPAGKLVHRLTPRCGSEERMAFSSDRSKLVTAGEEMQLWMCQPAKRFARFPG